MQPRSSLVTHNYTGHLPVLFGMQLTEEQVCVLLSFLGSTNIIKLYVATAGVIIINVFEAAMIIPVRAFEIATAIVVPQPGVKTGCITDKEVNPSFAGNVSPFHDCLKAARLFVQGSQ